MSTLWFDVKIEEYTTSIFNNRRGTALWFDVKIEEYTTNTDFVNSI